MELICVEDAHLTYPPRFLRHRDGSDLDFVDVDPDGLDAGSGGDEEEEEDTGRKGAQSPTVALRGITLSISAGEGIALVGKLGCGRTSLLSLISGVLRPDEGTVLVRGRATGLPAAGVGFIGHLSVSENVTRNLLLMGEPIQHARELAPVVAEWVGLGNQLATPNSALGRPLVRQLGYATALHAEPTVFLADEDVAFLPKPLREKAIERMLRFRDDSHALVVAVNRLELANRLCSRAVLIEAGTVVMDGDVTSVIERFRAKKDAAEEVDPDEPTEQ